MGQCADGLVVSLSLSWADRVSRNHASSSTEGPAPRLHSGGRGKLELLSRWIDGVGAVGGTMGGSIGGTCGRQPRRPPVFLRGRLG